MDLTGVLSPWMKSHRPVPITQALFTLIYFGVSPKILKAVFKIMCEKIKITVIRTTKVLAICLHESIFLEFSTNRPSLLVCGRVIIQEHKLI